MKAERKDSADPQTAQEIRAFTMKLDETYNKNDAAATAALFTADAIEARGWEKCLTTAFGQHAIERRYAFKSSSTGKITHTLVQVYRIGDDICAISEFYHNYFQRKGYFVTIYVREGDEWKIRMAYVN